MARPDEIEDERRRARQVRLIVDFTCAMIAQGRPRRRDADEIVAAARSRILDLFPGREQTYEIVCAPRFRRVIAEFALPDVPTPSAVVLTFPARRLERPEPD